MFGRLPQGTDAKNLLRRARVNILSGSERFDEHRVFRKMGQDTQFNLRIIGGEQSPTRFGDKGGANLPAQFSADGYILQVRLGRTQATGSGTGLAESSVQAPRARLNQGW